VLSAVILAPTLACDLGNTSKSDPFPAPAVTAVASASVPVTGDCSLDRLPPDPPNLDNKRYIVVYGCVEDGFQPLELITAARDNTTGEFGEHTEPSAHTEVRYIIGYDTGHHVTLHVELKPSRTGSKKGFLYISDGEGNRKIVKIDKGWRALADFTARR
jgi:hypothetical protein